jgi:hypothetical protein
MSIFKTILSKLGFPTADDKPAAPAAAAKPGAQGPSLKRDQIDPLKPSAQPAPASRAISEVDVMKKLEDLGAGSGLDWKVSIVDLLKLLKIDSSREARNELAQELGCPADLMSDSAKMNTWLHKAVLRKIAENGGNVPRSLYD